MCIRDSSSIDQRIDYRWVDLRTDENQLMCKAQSCMVNAMRKFLLDQNFIEIHTPKLDVYKRQALKLYSMVIGIPMK